VVFGKFKREEEYVFYASRELLAENLARSGFQFQMKWISISNIVVNFSRKSLWPVITINSQDLCSSTHFPSQPACQLASKDIFIFMQSKLTCVEQIV
jgi:hypothetical protein